MANLKNSQNSCRNYVEDLSNTIWGCIGDELQDDNYILEGKLMKLFKKSIVPLTMILNMSVPLACFADCPPPSDITITKNADGTYTVTPPSGYQYGGANYPISATGPIELAGVNLISNSPNFDNVSVRETDCSYGINGSSGTYPGGIIIIYNTDKFTTSLDPKNWMYIKMNYICSAWKSNCSFAKE